MARDHASNRYILDMPLPIAVLAALSALLFFALVGGRIVYKMYRIPSGAMQPTLAVGDYVIVDKFAYVGGRAPRRGDIVIVRDPHEEGEYQDFVERVVGLPGDHIQLVGGGVHINGSPVSRNDKGERRFIDPGDDTRIDLRVWDERLPGSAQSHLTYDRYDGPGDDTQMYIVPPDTVFLMGDDRDNSSDSRLEMGGFGPVQQSSIVGKLVHIMPVASERPPT